MQVACVLPAVKGKSIPSAESSLSRAHCAVGAVKRIRSPRVRKGVVISQQPGSGRKEPGCYRVSIVLSAS